MRGCSATRSNDADRHRRAGRCGDRDSDRTRSELTALEKTDPRLQHACEELAYFVAHGGDPTPDVATAVLRMHGIVDPPELVLTGTTKDDFKAKLGDDVWRPNAVVGRGEFETTAVEILIYIPNIRLEPVPRAAIDGVDLVVDLDPALHDPHVKVADARASQVLEPIADEHGFHVHVPCGEAPVERYVSIEAIDPRVETAPLVIFPIYCKQAAPTSLQAEPKGNVVDVTPQKLVAILNRERATRKLLPLHRDWRVEAAAQEYVRDRAQGRNSDPQVILHRAIMLAPATAWTTFHADSLESAIDRVVNNPEEMTKLSDPERTDIGAAALRVNDGWWVSIIYITIPRPIDVEKQAFLIRNQIRALRENAREHSTEDEHSNIVAQRFAEGLALGWSRAPLETRALADLTLMGGSADVVVDKRTELGTFDIRAVLKDHPTNQYGVGVAQSARDGALTGTIWIVVMLR